MSLALQGAGKAVDVAGVPFSPTDIAGILGWWKADALALGNGAAVSAWADSSGAGHGLTQATGANQPIYNTAQVGGQPAVTFDGANDYMATAAFASPTAGATWFSVLKLSALNTYRTLACHAAAATWVAPFARVLARVTDDTGLDEWQWIVEDATVGANTSFELAVASTTWQIMEFVYDQTDMKIRRNGTEVATKARAGALTSSNQALFIGADTSLGDCFIGQIAESIYYNSGLSAGNLGSIRTYLQGKYGL